MSKLQGSARIRGAARVVRTSEVKLRAELQQSRIAIAGHLAIGSRAHRRADTVRIRVIENVVRFRAELEFRALPEVHVLEDRDVPPLESRPMNDPAAGLARQAIGGQIRQ